MRKARLKARPEVDLAYYHCISRVVDRQFRFGDGEKQELVALMRRYERFCGVRVVTFCMMSNHFHLLLEVNARALDGLTDEDLWARVRDFYSGGVAYATLRQMWERFVEQGHAGALEEMRMELRKRMGDVSAFMKGFKQRFTQWYNRRHARRGTLWEERFKSVLVEGGGEALATMAAYIDLNPVRAGLVSDPGEYRWCGYAEAVAGRRAAREGLRIAAQAAVGGQSVVSSKEALAIYRRQLWEAGEEQLASEEELAKGTAVAGASGSPGETAPTMVSRRGFRREDVERVLAEGGQLSRWEALQCRVRYFSDGCVLGSKVFVEQTFQGNREWFGAKRETGARKLRHVACPGLFVIRDLRLQVVT